MWLLKTKWIDGWIKRQFVRITPQSAQGAGLGEQVCDWCRLHGVDPSFVLECKVFPALRLVCFKYADSKNGHMYLAVDWWSGEYGVSYSWWPKRLRAQPREEWTMMVIDEHRR